MSISSPANYLRTTGYVLRRTNYGEADRILDLLTPHGKISAIAKGVRKEKSKLAGNIEMFCLSDFNIHQGRTSLNLIVGAKMLKFYQSILLDFSRLELASGLLKHANRSATHSDSSDFFDLIDQSFSALDQNVPLPLVETWFLFNLAKASGEEINLYRDTSCQKLQPSAKYRWDVAESALSCQPDGDISAPDIKFMRLLLSSPLALSARVKYPPTAFSKLLHIAKVVNKL